jgi:serine-type D-Ala-D-Ala carboxypeptidase/endopeptidase (penicillin-binding protein 4)
MKKKPLFLFLFLSLLFSPFFATGAVVKSKKRRAAPEPAVRLIGETESERISECADHISGVVRNYRRGTFGILIQTEAGEDIYSQYASTLLKPASNLKLITSAVAIEKLTPDFVYKTEFFTDGEIIEGVLHGNLIITGTTDPILSGYFDKRIDDITSTWVDTLLAHGIHQINGELILDNSYYSGNRSGDSDQDESQPIKFETVASFSRADEKQLSKVSRLRKIRTRKGKIRIVRSGFRRRSHLKRCAIEPNQYALVTFLDALKKRSMISAESVSRLDFSPTLDRTKWKYLYTHSSLTLAQVLKQVLKNSDNFYADQLLRTLAELRGQASIEKGLEVVKEFLTTTVGVERNDFKLADGSGLSHDNFVTPALLVSVMKYMRSSGKYFSNYYESLSIPMVDGTLADRIPHELARNIHAKTGEISGVISLSGYLKSRSGTNIYFSIIGHNAGRKGAKHLEDRICKYLLEI